MHEALHTDRWRPAAEEVPGIALQLAEACAHVHGQGTGVHVILPWSRAQPLRILSQCTSMLSVGCGLQR